ncbi:MAG: HDOD domain-containing protein [Ectothiorhodospiraceae bacterium]|nr:HDOD domain-containing protein [Ectothiorhodospiraceae bacterium]
MLESLVPLRELTPEALTELAREAEIEELEARSIIFRKGADDAWSRYVLSGTVVLVDDEQRRRTVTGTGNAGVAPEPLSQDRPYPCHAVAGTDVKLIRLPAGRIQELLESSRLPQYGVNELAADSEDAGENLFYRLFEDLMSDRLELPSMPDIALRVRDAITEREAGAGELAKILQTDPVVAARVIQAANSAVYSGQPQVDSLQPAITRLGLMVTREVVTAVALRGVFRSKNPTLNKRMVELWMHSSLVAAIAQVTARRLKGFEPDRGLLAGLVHDIGVIPMVTNAEHYPELVQDPGLLEATIQRYRGEVGTMILRRWNFHEDLIQVPMWAEHWVRDKEDPGPDYGDLVVVAQLQAMGAGPGAQALPAFTETPAYRRLGLEALGIVDGVSMLEEAREEIAEAQRLLIG